MPVVLPDTLTIEPLGEVAFHPDLRRPMGRRNATPVTVRGQLETQDAQRMLLDGSVKNQRAAYVVFCSRDLSRAGYQPSAGDRITSVTWNKTRTAESMNLYLQEPTTEGAGGNVRCLLSDRSPAKVE